MLQWSQNAEEYLSRCQELAILCLNNQREYYGFIKEFERISSNLFLVEQLKFYYTYKMPMVGTNIMPMKSVIDIYKLENLLKYATTQERKKVILDILRNLEKSIIKNKEMNITIENNVMSFDVAIRYFSLDDKKKLFNVMLNYATTLMNNNCYDYAKKILKQAMSLNIELYECCFKLLMCDYEVNNVNALIKSKKPIIDNQFYDMAVDLAHETNKEKYEEYLSIYESQKWYKEDEHCIKGILLNSKTTDANKNAIKEADGKETIIDKVLDGIFGLLDANNVICYFFGLILLIVFLPITMIYCFFIFLFKK
jgi:hypothetical protein